MINTIIVEDNIYMQRHLESLIADNDGFHIEASIRDAFEAVKLCDSNNIDLVLMDVQTLHNHSSITNNRQAITLMEKFEEISAQLSHLAHDLFEMSFTCCVTIRRT